MIGGIRFDLLDTPFAFDSSHQHGAANPEVAPTAHIQLLVYHPTNSISITFANKL